MTWNIKAKSTAVLIVAFAMVLGVGAYGSCQLRIVNAEAADIRDNWMPAIKDLGEIKFVITRLRFFAARRLITRDPDQIAELKRREAALTEQLAGLISHYEASIADVNERALWDKFNQAWRAYIAEQDGATSDVTNTGLENAVNVFNTQMAQHFDEALAALDADIEFSNRESVLSAARAQAAYEDGLAVTFVVVTAALTFLCAVGVLVSRDVLTPLLRVTKAMNKLANGDLKISVPFAHRRDEIGAMADQLDVFKNNLIARKAAEDEVRILNCELEARVIQRTAALEQANKELEQTNKELESFAYSVSHDLRTPLRAIEGFSAILLAEHRSQLDEEGQRCLTVIRHGAQKVAKLIDDLLDYSFLLRRKPDRRPVDVGALALMVFDELKAATPGAGIRLDVGETPVALCDRDMMRQVLAQLLGNAIKFTSRRDNAVVEILGVRDGEEVIYSVKDNGAGFDMRYAHKLFGVFQRLHGVEEFPGTGIGLAIVKRIVDIHDGRVWAEGQTGEGAVIHFAIPNAENVHD